MNKIIAVIGVIFLGFSLTANAQEFEKEPMFVIKTNYGNIACKLYNDTPQHRDNFIKLVKQGWYEGSPFHRIIKGFMIQGGSNADGRQDPGYRIPAEFSAEHIHKRGAIAAARMGDDVNPQKMSSGCQFYIVHGRRFSGEELSAIESRMGITFTDEQRKTYTTIGGAPHLDGEYTVFGEVLSGMDVVDKIASVEVDRSKPLKPVTMTIEMVE